MQLDSAKMLARGTKVKAAQADRQLYHSHWDFDQYIPDKNDILVSVEEDCDVWDSVPDQSQLDVYFRATWSTNVAYSIQLQCSPFLSRLNTYIY